MKLKQQEKVKVEEQKKQIIDIEKQRIQNELTNQISFDENHIKEHLKKISEPQQNVSRFQQQNEEAQRQQISILKGIIALFLLEKIQEQEPEYIQKLRSNQALSTSEKRECQRYYHDKELKYLQTKQLCVPGRATFAKLINLYRNKKNECFSFNYCPGKFNQYQDGVFDRCGKMNPFILWDQVVTERMIEKDLTMFMKHYEIPLFEAPQEAYILINGFFQAKYAMFYCNTPFGVADFDPVMISKWEKSPKQLYLVLLETG
ncbi:UNKNOWN [Stylonychia lemnae]|uniref:Uncharacterized protein n=1 Tax=Stylonychia lemnae TaxID=5949 RepID=A0A078ATF2_STYLE|nr:UNKNOWN [Stylonychia lemnae]|eukprot:CDW84452.1 UNKNOWN [Stylonychia lemnae]